MKIKKFKDFKKRKKTQIRKISNGTYNWIPNFDRSSPAPQANYAINIQQIKL